MQQSVIRLALAFFISGLSLESVYAGLEDGGASSSSSSSSSTSSSSFSSSVSEVYPCVRSNKKLDNDLRAAALDGDVEKAKEYIGRGANVNAVDQYNFPALYLATQKGHLNVVKVLLEAGASVDPRRIADLQLIERNVGDHKNGLGHSALYFAVAEGHIAIVELLLDRDDVDINAQSDNGTPLFAALGNKSSDVFKLLIQRGANVDSESKYGLTVLHVLAAREFTENNQDLLDQVLLRSNACDLQDRDSRTPLHWAAELGRLHAVMALIKKKANLNLQDRFGNTPLMSAIRANRWDIAQALINAGADLNILNSFGVTHLEGASGVTGYTALDYAQRSKFSLAQQEVVNLLRERGGVLAQDLEGSGGVNGAELEGPFEEESQYLKNPNNKSGASSSVHVLPDEEPQDQSSVQLPGGQENPAANMTDVAGLSSSSSVEQFSGAGFAPFYSY